MFVWKNKDSENGFPRGGDPQVIKQLLKTIETVNILKNINKDFNQAYNNRNREYTYDI